MMGLIFVGVNNVMPLSTFKVMIIKVISVRKSGRVEQFNILLTKFIRS